MLRRRYRKSWEMRHENSLSACEPAMFTSLLFVAGETAGVKSCQSQKQS
jgi:hypothetical protein